MLAMSVLTSAAEPGTATDKGNQTDINMKTLELTREWDKTFPQSDKVEHSKVTFTNRYGTYALAGGVVDPLPEDAPQFVKDYHTYYKTSRGYHSRSLNSNGGWNVTSSLSFLNMPIMDYAGEIRRAVLLIHGEKAHSRYFSEDTFKKLTGDNKELLIIPGASHVDLYDNFDKIPFDKIVSFYTEHLK